MPTLSVVIPCFNEAGTIEAIVEAVRANPIEQTELIVVDDGSTDGTVDVLRTKLEGRVDRLICHDRNRGKGAALRSGFAVATGQIVLIQDADLEYDPRDYPRLLEPILDGRADVVFGSRFAGGEPHRVLYFWPYVLNRLLTICSNICTNLNLTDMETCYKAFRTEVIRSFEIKANRFGIEPEITAKTAKGGWRIYEVPISYAGRTYNEGKKITWKDGMIAFWYVVRYWFAA